MDQKQLTYFIAVAKYRNFSRAAQDFYLTQPAISHQIKMLEKELDTELFVRNTKKVTLTDSGELFLEDAKSILDAMEQAKQKLDLAKEQPSVLRISHLSAPTHQFLPEVVNQFHIRYPHIKIKLMRQDALQISETAARQDADIYYSMMPDPQQIFIQVKLFRDAGMETDLCTQFHDPLVHVSGMLRMKNEEWFRGEFVIIQNHFL